MASFVEISQSIERRLEEVLEESNRLRAALKALGTNDARATRGLDVRRTARPVLEILDTNDPLPARTKSQPKPVTPRRGYELTPANRHAMDGDDASPGAAVKRAISQLRRELAAGLRNA